MTTLYLYELLIDSADTTQKTDDFIREQTKITRGVKQNIATALKRSNLSGQFAFAAKRVAGVARSVQIYATEEATNVIRGVKNVKDVKPLTVSIYPKTREV